MAEIKIYEKKNSFYILVIVYVVILVGYTYYLFFSENSIPNSLYYIYVAFIIHTGYSTYVSIKRKLDRIPRLVISDFAIEASEYLKITTYLWSEIIDWKIDLIDGTHYLILNTTERKKIRINISYLEKTPSEIREIIQNRMQH